MKQRSRTNWQCLIYQKIYPNDFWYSFILALVYTKMIQNDPRCVFLCDEKRRKPHGNLDKISSNSQVLGALVRQQARLSTHPSVFDGCFRSQKSDPPKCSKSSKNMSLFLLFLCIIRYVESLKTKPSMKFSWNSMKQCTSSFNRRWNSPIKAMPMHSGIVGCNILFCCDCNGFRTINHAISHGPTPDILHGLNIQLVRLFFPMCKRQHIPFIQNIFEPY